MLLQQENICCELQAHEAFLFNWLKKFLGDRETAKDVLQNVNLHVLEFAAQSEIENPKAFMFKVARNLAYSEIRRQIRFDSAFVTTGDYSLGELSQVLESAGPSPEQTASLKDDVKSIFDIINALPKQQRRTVLMHRIDGLSYKEIAKKLDVSVSSVEKYMSNALKTIHRDFFAQEPSRTVN